MGGRVMLNRFRGKPQPIQVVKCTCEGECNRDKKYHDSIIKSVLFNKIFFKFIWGKLTNIIAPSIKLTSTAANHDDHHYYLSFNQFPLLYNQIIKAEWILKNDHLGLLYEKIKRKDYLIWNVNSILLLSAKVKDLELYQLVYQQHTHLFHQKEVKENQYLEIKNIYQRVLIELTQAGNCQVYQWLTENNQKYMDYSIQDRNTLISISISSQQTEMFNLLMEKEVKTGKTEQNLKLVSKRLATVDSKKERGLYCTMLTKLIKFIVKGKKDIGIYLANNRDDLMDLVFNCRWIELIDMLKINIDFSTQYFHNSVNNYITSRLDKKKGIELDYIKFILKFVSKYSLQKDKAKKLSQNSEDLYKELEEVFGSEVSSAVILLKVLASDIVIKTKNGCIYKCIKQKVSSFSPQTYILVKYIIKMVIQNKQEYEYQHNQIEKLMKIICNTFNESPFYHLFVQYGDADMVSILFKIWKASNTGANKYGDWYNSIVTNDPEIIKYITNNRKEIETKNKVDLGCTITEATLGHAIIKNNLAVAQAIKDMHSEVGVHPRTLSILFIKYGQKSLDMLALFDQSVFRIQEKENPVWVYDLDFQSLDILHRMNNSNCSILYVPLSDSDLPLLEYYMKRIIGYNPKPKVIIYIYYNQLYNCCTYRGLTKTFTWLLETLSKLPTVKLEQGHITRLKEAVLFNQGYNNIFETLHSMDQGDLSPLICQYIGYFGDVQQLKNLMVLGDSLYLTKEPSKETLSTKILNLLLYSIPNNNIEMVKYVLEKYDFKIYKFKLLPEISRMMANDNSRMLDHFKIDHPDNEIEYSDDDEEEY